MIPPRSLLALTGLLLAAACSTSPRIVEARTGAVVGIDAVADACVDKDVVFFGEVHSSDECHEQQRRLLDALRQRKRDVVVSMEMFDRDVQDKLDAYLSGKLPEPEFRKQARTWPGWAYYRPIVQIAAMHGLPVLAANAPRELVRKVARKDGGGLAGLRGNPHVAREFEASEDDYYKAFVKEMEEHMGSSGEAALRRMYEAQVVRDETMAETIADYLAKAHKDGRRPLVLHLCGNFHSKAGRGTVQRLLRRNPGLDVSVITTGEGALPGPGDGDWLVAVTKRPNPPRFPAAKSTTASQDSAKQTTAKQTTAKPEPKPAPDPNARPGLGFMPAYEGSDEPGCGVQMVMDGSPAAKAGIKKGDLIVKLDGEEIDDVRAYSEVLGGLEIGSKVKVVVVRDGKRLELEVTVGESRR